LLKYLDEIPITVPYQENINITVITLTSYYDSLVASFEKNEKNRAKNVLSNKNLPTTEIVNMELYNSY